MRCRSYTWSARNSAQWPKGLWVRTDKHCMLCTFIHTFMSLKRKASATDTLLLLYIYKYIICMHYITALYLLHTCTSVNTGISTCTVCLLYTMAYLMSAAISGTERFFPFTIRSWRIWNPPNSPNRFTMSSNQPCERTQSKGCEGGLQLE